MQLWNKECDIVYDSDKSKGQLVIFTDRILIQKEKTKLFGLMFDGYTNYHEIKHNNIKNIKSIKNTGNNVKIIIITDTRSIELEFENADVHPLEEIKMNLEISKKLSQSSKFSVNRVIKEYYQEIGNIPT